MLNNFRITVHSKKFFGAAVLLGMLVPSVGVFADQQAANLDATTSKKAIGNRLTTTDYNAIIDILSPLNVNAAGELATEELLTVPSFKIGTMTAQTGVIENSGVPGTDWATTSNATLATSAAIEAYVNNRVEAAVGAGTVDYQALYWDNTASKWTPTSEMLVNPGTGLTVSSGLVVSAGGATITGNSSVTGTLDVTGLASLDGGIDLDGVFTVADSSGDVATTGTLSAAATTVTSTLDVTGLASLDGGIDLDGVFTVADSSGDVATTGTLAVTGATTVTGGLKDADVTTAVPLGDGSNTDLSSFTATSILGALAELKGDASGMSTLADGRIYVGDSGNNAAEVAPGGEVAMTNTGSFTLNNSAVIGKVLTGFTSGAGTVAATDTILEAVQKLDGNSTVNGTNIATNASNIQDINSLTENYMYTGNASNVISAVEINTTVTGQALTGFSAAAGTVAETDTILEAVEKLAGTVEEITDAIDLGTQTTKGTCDATNVGQLEYVETTNGSSNQEGVFWGCVAVDNDGSQTYSWVAISIFES